MIESSCLTFGKQYLRSLEFHCYTPQYITPKQIELASVQIKY